MDYTVSETDNCTSARLAGSEFRRTQDNKCNERSLPFFCQASSTRDLDNVCDFASTSAMASTSGKVHVHQTSTLYPYNDSNNDITFDASLTSILPTSSLYDNVTLTFTKKHVSSDNKIIGTIIGAVVAVCVVIAVGVVIFILIWRYRKTQIKRNECNRAYSENSVSFVEKPEKINKDFAFRLDSIPTQEENNYSMWKHQDQVKELQNEDTVYELAQIPKRIETEYEYSDTVEGNYDILNQRDDRKIKIIDEEDTNCYTHTADIDGTYDTTNLKSHTNDVFDTYDHANISGVVTCDVDDIDPYDHTN